MRCKPRSANIRFLVVVRALLANAHSYGNCRARTTPLSAECGSNMVFAHWITIDGALFGLFRCSAAAAAHNEVQENRKKCHHTSIRKELLLLLEKGKQGKHTWHVRCAHTSRVPTGITAIGVNNVNRFDLSGRPQEMHCYAYEHNYISLLYAFAVCRV